jgi:hypothetical protein
MARVTNLRGGGNNLCPGVVKFEATTEPSSAVVKWKVDGRVVSNLFGGNTLSIGGVGGSLK